MRSLPALGRVTVQFDAVAVRVGNPGLPGLVHAQFGVRDLHPLRPQVLDDLRDVLHFQADVAVTLLFGARGQVALEELQEVPRAGLEIDPVARAVVALELEGEGEPEFPAVEGQRAVQIGDDEAGVCESGDLRGGSPLAMRQQ